VISLGSIAARELGYNGDVDVIVLYEGDEDTVGGRRAGVSFAEYVARVTQRAIGLLSAPHRDGPGYAVDVRLRPSGAQGTLITTLPAFDRYHRGASTDTRAAGWERQALVRARAIAGDPALCARASALIASVAFDGAPPDPAEVRRIRARMERELGQESPTKISLKHGRGSLVDVEFATQLLQMRHGGSDPALRSPTTRVALRALRDRALLSREDADALLHAEKVLRRTLLAARLVHGGSSLDLRANDTHTVARKLGYRGRENRTAKDALVADLERTRHGARAAFERVLDQCAGSASGPSEGPNR
jgi:glutamate-ammonia-ligase adenylyltransferase